MVKINYDEYFDGNEDKYYNPEVMMSLFEKLNGKDFDSTVKMLNKNKVKVTGNQIETYLNKKFEEDDPELKARINDKKRKTKNVYDADNFIDNLKAKKYAYNPKHLEYYKSYSEMCAFKAKTILLIIGSIYNNETYKIKDMLLDLDIQLDERKYILKSDIIRLVNPAVYNINEFEKTIEDANNLNTYLEKKFTEEALIDGLIRCEEKEIQKKNLYNDLYEGNIPLTEKQKEEIKETHSKIMTKFLNMIEE